MLIEYVHIPAKGGTHGERTRTKIEGPEEPPTVLAEETVKGLGTSVPSIQINWAPTSI